MCAKSLKYSSCILVLYLFQSVSVMEMVAKFDYPPSSGASFADLAAILNIRTTQYMWATSLATCPIKMEDIVPVSYEDYLSASKKYILYTYNEATLSAAVQYTFLAALATLSKIKSHDLKLLSEFKYCSVANYSADFALAIVQKAVSNMLIIET